jgi:putative glutamine amidotransferase
MSRRPVIGIPTQTLQSLGNCPEHYPPSWVMSQRYILTLTAAGAVPWMMPLVGDDEATARAMYDELDAVFLPGGADIDPASYGAVRHPKTDKNTDPPRDHLELAVVRWAMADGKPVLGVCRGIQVMNLAMGGTHYQDVMDEHAGAIKHDYFPFGTERWTRDHLAHAVQIERATRLGDIVSAREVPVNSMHHQGIRELAPLMVPTAYAPDGLVEGAEGTGDTFFVGVQWHPEVLTDSDERMRRLFDAFIDAALEYRAQGAPAGLASVARAEPRLAIDAA